MSRQLWDLRTWMWECRSHSPRRSPTWDCVRHESFQSVRRWQERGACANTSSYGSCAAGEGPERVAWPCSKGHRGSEKTSGVDGSLRLEQSPQCARILSGEQMSGKHTPVVSAKRWEGTFAVAVLRQTCTNMSKAEISKEPEAQWMLGGYPSLHEITWKQNLYTLNSYPKTILYSNRESWKKSQRVIIYPKVTELSSRWFKCLQSTHIETYLLNGFLRKADQL